MTHLSHEFFELLGEAVGAAERVAGARWKPSFNHFVGVLLDDLRFLCGHVPGPRWPPPEEREQIARDNHRRSRERAGTAGPGHPTRHSWLDVAGESFVTPVRNQEFCAACTAFGSVAAIETAAHLAIGVPCDRSQPSALPALSAAQVFFCSPGDHSCKTGWTIEGALDYCRDTGVVPAESFPFVPGLKPSRFRPEWNDKVTRISGYDALSSVEAMKQWLSRSGPLIGIMNVYLDFCLYGHGVYSHVLGPAVGSHAVCCIGYDDEIEAWLCKNSWGPLWGEHGFFWIGYGECGIDATMWAIQGLATIYRG